MSEEEIEIMQRLLDLYIRAKERNKDLNFENQSLFESIDCNDDNMLARRYQNIKKETKILKDKIRDIIKDLDDFDIYIFDIKAFKLAVKNSLEELLKEEQ